MAAADAENATNEQRALERPFHRECKGKLVIIQHMESPEIKEDS